MEGERRDTLFESEAGKEMLQKTMVSYFCPNIVLRIAGVVSKQNKFLHVSINTKPFILS